MQQVAKVICQTSSESLTQPNYKPDASNIWTKNSNKTHHGLHRSYISLEEIKYKF